MSRTLTIAGKEIRGALTSPLGYVFVLGFATLALAMFFLKESFFANDQASVRGLFAAMPWLLALVCPALTMRLWADEKRLGTYEVLATLPLRPFETVAGKFLASVALLAGALFFTLGAPIVAEIYGDLDWGPVVGGYVGALLLGCAYLAIGLVCSALVQDQFLALFFGWLLCGLTLLPDAAQWETLPSVIADTFRNVGFGGRFLSIERGVLDLNDLLFYISVCAFFLVLNVALIEWRRYSLGDAGIRLSSRRGINLLGLGLIAVLTIVLIAAGLGTTAVGWILLAVVLAWMALNLLTADRSRSRYGTNLVVTVALVAVNLILLNWWISGQRIARIDLTEGNIYSLTEETKDVLSGLEEQAEIIFYYSSPETQHEKLRPLIAPMKDALGEFAVESGGNLTVRFIELDTAGKDEQEFATQSYGIRTYAIPVRSAFQEGYQNTYFALVVVYGSEYERIDIQKLIRAEERGASDWGLELTDIELLVTQALRKLSRGFDSVPGALVARDKTAKITFYLSDVASLPKQLEGVGETVRKACEKLSKQSGGRLSLEIVDPYAGRDPAEYPDIERELYRRTGVRPVAADPFSKATFYSWAVIAVGDREDSLPFITLDEKITEADVRELIEGSLRRLIPGFLTSVGFASNRPPFNPMMMQMGQRPPPDEFARISESLGEAYEVENIDLSGAASIPEQVSVLVLMRPGELDQKALFKIDQFLMRGGRLVVCADAFHLDAQRSQQTGTIEVTESRSPTFYEMLRHYGVKVSAEAVRDTRCQYLLIPQVTRVAGIPVQTLSEVNYRYLARIDADGWSKDSPMAAGVARSSLFWAAPLEVVSPLPEGVEAAVFATTSKEASAVTTVLDLDAVLNSKYVPPEDAHEIPLVVALKGTFTSWFRDKAIPGLEPGADEGEKDETGATEGEEKPAETEEKAKPQGAPLLESRPASILVIGDSDFVSPTTLGMLQLDRDYMDDNLRLLRNAIDWNGPDQDLAGMRSRPAVRRPLHALAGLSGDEREESGERATTLTFAITSLLIIGVGVLWYLGRRARRPIELIPVSSHGE